MSSRSTTSSSPPNMTRDGGATDPGAAAPLRDASDAARWSAKPSSTTRARRGEGHRGAAGPPPHNRLVLDEALRRDAVARPRRMDDAGVRPRFYVHISKPSPVDNIKPMHPPVKVRLRAARLREAKT